MVMAMGEGGVKAQLAKPSLSKLILNLAEPHSPPTLFIILLYIYLFFISEILINSNLIYISRGGGLSL